MIARGCAAGLLLALLVAGEGSAACVSESEPNDGAGAAQQLDGTDWCVKGSAASGDQDWVAFDLDAPQLLYLQLEAPPGVSGTVQLVDEQEDGGQSVVWSGPIDQASGHLASPELVLRAGRWRAVVQGSSDKLRWRLRGHRVNLPPAVDPALRDAFRGTVAGTGQTVEIPWTLGPEAATAPWTLHLQGPIEIYAGLELRAPDDTQLFDQTAGGFAQDLSRSDLGLAPGQYILRVKALQPGDVAVLEAQTGQSDGDLQREPDDSIERAHSLIPAMTLTARLSGSGGSPDKDFYGFDVLPDTPQRQIAFTLSGPPDQEIDATLTDAAGADISDVLVVRGADKHLGPFAVPPGHYGLRLTGNLPPDQSYRLTMTDAPPVAPGTEAEPNDRTAFATPMAAGGTLSGDVGESATDFVAIEAPPGDLRWWNIRVTTDSSVQAELWNGQGVTLNSGSRFDPGEMTLARLPLAPGPNLLRLRGSGAWRLSVEPADPPGLGDEHEPNDGKLAATPLTAGQPTRFWLDHDGDTDTFVLQLTTPQRLSLDITLPADAQPRAILVIPGAEAGSYLEFEPDLKDPTLATTHVEAMLPPGSTFLSINGGVAEASPGMIRAMLAPPVPIALPGSSGRMQPSPKPLASDDPRIQRLTGTAELVPPAGFSGTARVIGWVSDRQWRLNSLPATVEVSGGSVALPWRLEAPSYLLDGEHGDFAVALTDAVTGETLALAQTAAFAAAGAEPVDPAPDTPLPAPLMGTIDAARTDFGATFQPDSAAPLFDGQLDGSALPLDLGSPVTVRLAGDALLPVAGLILTPPAIGDRGTRLRRLRAEASEAADGPFLPIWEGEIDPTPDAQPILLDAPVQAQFIRLIPESDWGGGDGSGAVLSELSVLVAPRAVPEAFDLARRELGGHFVLATPASAPLVGENVTWPDQTAQFQGAKGEQAYLVMSFWNDRAAAIQAVRVVNDMSIDSAAQIGMLQVEASMEGPLGPWTKAGDIAIDPATGEGELHPDAPLWARALRFVIVDRDAQNAYLPARISVIEDRQAEGGGTILAEFGANARAATWEQAHMSETVVEGVKGGASPDIATALPPRTLATGQLSNESRHKYYRLDPPADALTLRIDRDRQGAALVLTDASGKPVTLQDHSDGMTAEIADRTGPFLLDVSKPRDNIVIAWDTSGSVAGFAEAIFAAVEDLAKAMEQGDLAMNFVPFRSANQNAGGMPINSTFATDAGTAWGILNTYTDIDSDSDGETALIVAANALAKEAGRHAIVLITDASFSPGYTEQAWAAIGLANPRIYALRVPTGSRDNAARAQAAMMQDWASFNGGEHRIFADPADARAAFRDLVADLRKPVPYRLTWSFATEPPPDGLLAVRWGHQAATGPYGPRGAIEIILDASGSMLQKVGGKRKIELAKNVLAQLTAQGLPPGTDFALRVFGLGGKGSCEGRAVLPLGPLDPGDAKRAIASVRATNGAKTAIGASLRDAGTDLAGAAGRKLIVLITDGEETCGGDPSTEIAALRAGGLDVRLNIVGFNLDDPALVEQFRNWAGAGAGAFFDAADGAALDAAIRAAVALEFRLIASDGSVVATGVVDGPPVSAPEGSYTLDFGDATKAPQSVELTSGETQTVTLQSGGLDQP